MSTIRHHASARAGYYGRTRLGRWIAVENRDVFVIDSIMRALYEHASGCNRDGLPLDWRGVLAWTAMYQEEELLRERVAELVSRNMVMTEETADDGTVLAITEAGVNYVASSPWGSGEWGEEA